MAFKMHEIRELIRLIDESQIEEFEIDNEGAKLLIRKTSDRAVAVTPAPQTAPVMVPSPVQAAAPVQQPAPAPQETKAAEAPQPAETVNEEENLHKIVSPMVGTFYRAPSPDSDPYVKEGDKVDEKTVVCIVEAMKLMNEIEAETRGTIVKILVENGQLVEYGQPLFLVKTD
ncbi:acetyl-CoA carboxylase biotin carboxyl carrier protein [Paenactinomyces guangxiensis]|uniref:Biotin carboxyl carrier protein of acetyl-CoA carboxylase n=1 Tax=Paenactinomyces guangxiensis TaxID=1490290 RepID=A0A7W1WS51_9BACL|nr:acetyl-CoA carboxylase biotin carboxyl carrier protein [Paenactinomyces guangxiensis]MBA4494992.1 acetyl-CoA carboxylase biotin carboxyl carrier protein [Paenactinomyces guangxiensis]MBH8592075.1 acetyl-CoA carboxylase biotin carboxyl carrier protein [Paenactinomyces guangxiensis]